MTESPQAPRAPYVPPTVVEQPPPLWTPGIISHRDIRALSNCWNGEASPDEQRRALEATIYVLARTEDLGYFPDNLGGERDSAFLQGMRHVGMQLRKFASLGPTYLAKKESEARSSRKFRKPPEAQDPHITD